MAWWGDPLDKNSREPTRKNRFIIEMGNGGRLLSVSSVAKPSATVETREYRMINHFYNYPGLVKWNPITIKFVDAGFWGTAITNPDVDYGTVPTPQNRGTAETLWEMLVASGYTTPDGDTGRSNRDKSISSPEKAATMDLAFGSSIKIHQLKPEGTLNSLNSGPISSYETWVLNNPIIKSISWGDLDYGDDGLVEYTLEVIYDWAEFYAENKIDEESKSPTVGPDIN